MMRICLRYHSNADDAAASYNHAMYNVLAKIDQYKSEGEFMGWVRRIMVNTCLNAVKQQARFTVQAIAENEYERFHAGPDVYSLIQSKDILQMVQELPDNTALVFNLYIMEGYTHEQIADMLHISIGTSKWHLNNARTVLKEKMIKARNNEARKNAC